MARKPSRPLYTAPLPTDEELAQMTENERPEPDPYEHAMRIQGDFSYDYLEETKD